MCDDGASNGNFWNTVPSRRTHYLVIAGTTQKATNYATPQTHKWCGRGVLGPLLNFVNRTPFCAWECVCVCNYMLRLYKYKAHCASWRRLCSSLAEWQYISLGQWHSSSCLGAHTLFTNCRRQQTPRAYHTEEHTSPNKRMRYTQVL